MTYESPEISQFRKLIGELIVDLRENVEAKVNSHLKMLVNEEETERVALANILNVMNDISKGRRLKNTANFKL